jgi:pantothenate synthetase
MQTEFQKGERSAERLIAAGLEVFREEPAVRVDYLSVVDPESLKPLNALTSRALVAVAAYVGTTRLIDNVVLG